MEQRPDQPQQHKEQPDVNKPGTYLNHGVESLVAKDSPDDFQTIAAKLQKRGSRR